MDVHITSWHALIHSFITKHLVPVVFMYVSILSVDSEDMPSNSCQKHSKVLRLKWVFLVTCHLSLRPFVHHQTRYLRQRFKWAFLIKICLLSVVVVIRAFRLGRKDLLLFCFFYYYYSFSFSGHNLRLILKKTRSTRNKIPWWLNSN